MISRKNKSALEVMPGVGPRIAKDLEFLGIQSVNDLNGKDPQELYDEFCRKTGQQHDRCLLYVFRCAVYFASVRDHDENKLKWWNWSDAHLRVRSPKKTKM